MKKIALASALALLVMLLSGCNEKQAPSVSRTSFLLDTVITIGLYDWEDEDTLTAVMDEISRLESLLSVEHPGSDLSRLAQAAGVEWVDISPECQEVLTLAKEYWSLSEGHFDVTIGPLIKLWNIRDGSGYHPTQEELAAVRPKISSEMLRVGDRRAFLEEPGMEANLGAIAKGYIADQVKDFLEEAGVEHAVIDLGGNILTIGGRPDGSGFRIGIEYPFDEESPLKKELEGMILYVTEESVVTAGVDKRFFEQEGVRYHHILNPFTGYPADTGVASVTVISEESARGDALSTTCLLLGEEGLALIESLPGVEALFIREDHQLVMSSGFSGYLSERSGS